MSNEAASCGDILLRNVPGDIVRELERRAAANFRSRSGEIMAILASVCRGDATLQGLGVGETVPTRAEVANQDVAANRDGGEQEIGGEV